MTKEIIFNPGKVDFKPKPISLNLSLNPHTTSEFEASQYLAKKEESFTKVEMLYPTLTFKNSEKNQHKSGFINQEVNDMEGLHGSARKFFGLFSKIV
jgi:hypothetical protein